MDTHIQLPLMQKMNHLRPKLIFHDTLQKNNFTMSKIIKFKLLSCAGMVFLSLFTALLFADAPYEIPDWEKAYLPKTENWKANKQHFIFNNGTDPESLDPALITGVPESRLVGELFEGLVNLDPKTLEPRPGVAYRWEILNNGLTYKFHLRKNAKWSDGADLTAHDFYQSWKRVLTPSTGSSYAYQLFPVKGAKESHTNPINSFNNVGIKVIDKHTLSVQLHSPCNYFLDLVAFHTLFPVPVSLINKYKDQWVRVEHIISNGPFKLSAWKPRQKIDMVKNEHYWGSKICKLEKITVFPYDNLDTSYQLFLQNKILWMPAIPLEKLNEIIRNPDYYVMPYLGSYFYRFNVTKAPFDDVRVRKAFSLAINRRVITEHILKAGQQPATWFCPPVSGYEPVQGFKYNRDRARKLLAEAGYGANGHPFPNVEILYNTSEQHKKVAEAIVQQWKHNLGVSVSLRNTEWKVLLNDMDNLNFQIIRSSWIGDYGDPNTFFDMFVTNGGNNRTGWSNKEYDSLLLETQRETNKVKRHEIFQKMERLLVEKEFPILPLYIYVNQGVLNETVNGWYENVRDMHPLKYIWLED